MPAPLAHTEVLKLLRGTQAVLDKLYAKQARELASVMARYKIRNTADIWKDNPQLEREVDAILKTMKSDYARILRTQMQKGVNLSDGHLDNLVLLYAEKHDLSEDVYLSQLVREKRAMNAWIALRVKNFVLSPRVWKLDKQTKEALAEFIKSGLANGTNASTLATDLKKYLREPNRRFRRIRDPKTGKLILSAPAKAYRPGRGVYRSSYKNALRVARNEINMAYRQNDYLRIQKLDFVKGIRVNLSPAHPEYDICDELQGDYAKGFRFLGWHPNCLCYTTTILATRDEFVASRRTGEPIKTRVRGIPKRAMDYLNQNADQIKGLSSKPYFIRDNFKNTRNGFTLKKSVNG